MYKSGIKNKISITLSGNALSYQANLCEGTYLELTGHNQRALRRDRFMTCYMLLYMEFIKIKELTLKPSKIFGRIFTLSNANRCLIFTILISFLFTKITLTGPSHPYSCNIWLSLASHSSSASTSNRKTLSFITSPSSVQLLAFASFVHNENILRL